MQGLITKLISGAYTVVTEDFDAYVCKPRGTFRLNEINPKVGDKVIFDKDNKVILEVLPRKNDLIRPFVSNVDKMFLLFSFKEPNLNLTLLDRMLSILEYNSIESIIIFTKVDLINSESEIKLLDEITNYYKKIGYKVYHTSKFANNSFLLEEFKGCTCVFAGQSGAGKSTLLNQFAPDLQLKTQEISKALGRGKHTTRHTELHRVGDGWVADTPGFGIVDFEFTDLLSFSHSFKEFFEVSTSCKFKGC